MLYSSVNSLGSGLKPSIEDTVINGDETICSGFWTFKLNSPATEPFPPSSWAVLLLPDPLSKPPADTIALAPLSPPTLPASAPPPVDALSTYLPVFWAW